MEKKEKTGQKKTRNFPRATLEESLKIPQAIKDKNGGNSWPPAEVAKAINAGAKTNNFFYQTSSSQSFGFTKGTRDAAKIEIDTLGREIVYSPNPEVELQSKINAFFKIDIFAKVFNHYKGSSLPETKYLSNTLENEFSIPPEFHEEFVRLFKENCRYLNIEHGINGSGNDSDLETNRPSISTHTSETITLSEAKGTSALKAFVIMPFSERTGKYSRGFFDEVLNSLVTPAAADANFTVKTARRNGSDVIQSTIINELIDADLVIADLTEHNPNVLFELGVRMAMEKPVLLIRANGTDKIFDVDNMLRVFDYDHNLWTSTIKTDVPELTKHIKSSWENRKLKNYMQILKGK